MSMKIVRKHGKEYLVIDTRPSKKIRAAKRRQQKRVLEQRQHFHVSLLDVSSQEKSLGDS